MDICALLPVLGYCTNCCKKYGCRCIPSCFESFGHTPRHEATLTDITILILSVEELVSHNIVFLFLNNCFQSMWTTLHSSSCVQGLPLFCIHACVGHPHGCGVMVKGFQLQFVTDHADEGPFYVHASIYPSPFGELSNSLVGSGNVSPIPHVALSLCLCFARHRFKIFFFCQCISYLSSPRSHSNPILKLSKFMSLYILGIFILSLFRLFIYIFIYIFFFLDRVSL